MRQHFDFVSPIDQPNLFAAEARASVERQINLIADEMVARPALIAVQVYGLGHTLAGRNLVTVLADCRHDIRCARQAEIDHPNGPPGKSLLDLVAAEHALVTLMARRAA